MSPQEVMPYDYYTNPDLVHQRDTCLDILRLLNIQSKSKSYDVFYSEKSKNDALLFLSSFNSSKIIIGLNIEGSNNETKISDEDLKNLILGLYSLNSNIVIIIFHKPDDRDSLRELIPKESKSYAFLSYPTRNILDLAAIIDNVDIVISPDTSVVHISCAYNKPLIAIYRNHMEIYDIWHPISDCNKVIFSKYSDSIRELNLNDIINETFRLIRNIDKMQ